MDVVTWLLSRGKQRHGSEVQGNATTWYFQTAGDLDAIPTSPIAHKRNRLAATMPAGLVFKPLPAGPLAASTIESARECDGANQFAEDHSSCWRSLVPTR